MSSLVFNQGQLAQGAACCPKNHSHARLNHPFAVEVIDRTGEGEFPEQGLEDCVRKGFSLHMIDGVYLLLMQEEEYASLPFPYRHIDDFMHLQEAVEPSHQLKQRPDVELYLRFPWLEFKNPNLKKRYEYRGRDTQKSSPFFVRFTLAQEGEMVGGEFGSERDINSKLKEVIQGVVSPQIYSLEKKWQQSILDLNQIAGKMTLYSNDSQHHGYLLTGLARPCTTVNDAFDSLFPTLPVAKMEQSSEGSCLEMGSQGSLHIRCAPNQLKLNWQFKWHSYQYLFLMSRAYSHFHATLAQKLLPDELEQAIGRELFNYNMPIILRFFIRNHEEEAINEKEYFDFFTNFLGKHHKSILAQTGEEGQPREMVLVLEQGGKVQHHRVHPFNFESYLKRKFQSIAIPQQSLSRMVDHNRKRQKHILLTFPLKTRRERVEELKKLTNHNKDAFNRIELLPLNDLRQQSTPGEEDRRFLILLRREGASEETTCTLQEVVERCIARGLAEPVLRTQDVKIRLFQDIYMQETKVEHYPLLKHFSCDPEALVLEDGLLLPNFERLLTKTLQLDRLPLTQEQELLSCTPRQQMNVYQKLEELVCEYGQQLKSGTLADLCSVLSDEWCTFQPCDPTQQVKIGQDQPSQWVKGDQSQDLPGYGSSLSLKMKLLQVSMIDYQIANCRRCLYAAREEGKPVPFSVLIPQHYKQLRRTLALLLIQTNITPYLKFTHSQSQKEDLNSAAISNLAKRYQQNQKQYLRCIAENVNRRYFRQSDTSTFRTSIEGFFKELEAVQLNKGIKEALRVAHKAHLVLQCLKARLMMFLNADSRQRIMEGLRQLLQPMEQVSKEKETRFELIDRHKSKNNTQFCKQLKEGLYFINKELQQCKEYLQNNPKEPEQSSSSPSPSQSSQSLKIQSKIDKVTRYSLIWLCGIFADLLKQEDDLPHLLLLFRILMAFCCHLPQFGRNQSLQVRTNIQEMDRERLSDKIYKLKNVLLTELARIAKQSFLPHKNIGQ